MGAESRLVDIVGTHLHLVVPQPQVELGEELRTMELIQELVDDRNGVGILHCDGVQRAVIHAETPRAVRLLD
jgi:hypothetical protein